jgi:hypothetical protein
MFLSGAIQPDSLFLGELFSRAVIRDLKHSAIYGKFMVFKHLINGIK